MRNGKLTYRLRDRSLRSMHTYDAPLSLTPFADGALVVAWCQARGLGYTGRFRNKS